MKEDKKIEIDLKKAYGKYIDAVIEELECLLGRSAKIERCFSRPPAQIIINFGRPWHKEVLLYNDSNGNFYFFTKYPERVYLHDVADKLSKKEWLALLLKN